LKSLDLYAKIEHLIGFYEEYEELYEKYLYILNSLHVRSCLDIGCGNGKFLKLLQSEDYKAFGIDRSKKMLKKAKKLGVKVEKLELEELEKESFEAACAVGDVLNYMDDKELREFFYDLHKVLKKDGYFLADINTLYGFEEVTSGVFIKETPKKFLCIEADFENNVLTTNITLFKKKKKKYKKYHSKILQYYHSTLFFKNISGFVLTDIVDISMFGEETDKNLLVFKKV